MPESIVATIEYDKDQDDVQKVIDLDPDMPWNDFKMIISCFLGCDNFRVYYQDDEDDQVILSSEEEFQQIFKIAKKSRSINFKIKATEDNDPLSVFHCDAVENSKSDPKKETELKMLEGKMPGLSITPTESISIPPTETDTDCVIISIEDDHSTLKMSKEIQANVSDLEQKAIASKCVMTEISTEDSASQVTIDPSNNLAEEPEWFHANMEKYMIRLERMMKRDSHQRGKSVEVQTVNETECRNNYALVLSKQDSFDFKSRDEYLEEANVICENCQCFIIGHYFKCANCSDYNLCSSCEEFSEKIHLNNHVFLKIKIPLPITSLKRDRFGNLKPILKRNLYELRTRKMKKRKHTPIEFMEKKLQETQLENSSCLRRRRVPQHEPNFVQKLNAKFDAFFFGDCSHPDGTEVLPGTEFTKEWIVLNTGNQEWDNAVAITYLYGNLPSTQMKFPVKQLKPKDSGLIQVDLQAPMEPGHYTSYWILTRHGEHFGKKVWCSIVVPSPTDHSSCLEEEVPLLNQSFEYVESSPEPEQSENQVGEDIEGEEETSSIDSEFLIVPMPDCFDVTKPLSVDYEVEKKTVDDILAVSSHIKSETLEPEIALPPSIELDKRAETPDEEETNIEEVIFVDAQEITTEDTPVDVEVERCEIHLPSQNHVEGESIGNENQRAFYQKAFGVLNKVAKGAASAAVGTTKNVFQTLQAQQAYIPPQSKWVPPKNTGYRPETDEDWLRKREEYKKNDMDVLIAMGFGNRKLNAELLKTHSNNLDAVIDTLINRQENPIRK